MKKNILFVVLFLAVYASLQAFRGGFGGGKVELSPLIQSATDLNFDNLVGGAEWVLVDFWAPWCGPCRRLKPVINQLADKYQDRLRVVAVNVDIAPRTADSFGVSSIPTLILLRRGSVVDRRAGVASLNELEGWLGGRM